MVQREAKQFLNCHLRGTRSQLSKTIDFEYRVSDNLRTVLLLVEPSIFLISSSILRICFNHHRCKFSYMALKMTQMVHPHMPLCRSVAGLMCFGRSFERWTQRMRASLTVAPFLGTYPSYRELVLYMTPIAAVSEFLLVFGRLRAHVCRNGN